MSAGLFTCPTCQATLRVPAGATAVRCPQCKTVLTIEAPEPAAPPVAPPLPFGKKKPAAPKKSAAPPPPKTAKPVTAAPTGPIRAALVDEEAEEAEERAREAARRRAEAREIVREMDAEEEEREAEYEYLDEVCKKARTALQVLRIGVYCYALAIFLASVSAACMVIPFMYPVAAVAIPLGMATSQAGTILLAIGFVLALFGPPRGRPLAIAGCSAVAIQLAGIAVVLPKVIRLLMGEGIGEESAGMTVYHSVGLVSYLPLVADFPVRLIQGLPVSWLALILGAMEFIRLAVLCQLLELYSAEGKQSELGFRAQACGSRVLAMVVLGGLFHLALTLLFASAPKGEAMAYIGVVLQCAVLGTLMELAAYALFYLGYTMGEVIDVTTAERFAAQGETVP